MAGSASIMLYIDPNNAYKAYHSDLVDLSSAWKSIDGVGEEAAFVGMGRTGSTHAGDLAFKRCSALVHIYLATTSDEGTFVTYAKRMDARLAPILCN